MGRLRLREFRPDDLASSRACGSDQDLVESMTIGPNSEEDARGFPDRMTDLQRETRRVVCELAVVVRASGVHVGGAGLRVGKRSDLGCIFRWDRRGRGCATEMGREAG